MDQNVGIGGRLGRAVGGALALTCSVLAPLPSEVRVATFGTLGTYLLFTALSGRCLLGHLLGRARRSESRR